MMPLVVASTASLLAVPLLVHWLYSKHSKCILSLLRTNKTTAYGVYISFPETLFSHVRFLIEAALFGSSNPEKDRLRLEESAEKRFKELVGAPALNDHDEVLITHSCRVVFCLAMRYLMEQKKKKDQAARAQGTQQKQPTNNDKTKFRIVCHSVHFGSFYKLLQGMQLQEEINCEFDFYQVDLCRDNFALDVDSAQESEIAKSDLILLTHIFGAPLINQERLTQIGRKHNVPIIEDCVQSGSIFGKYKGNPDSDVVLWSGGLDKTPSCFSAGFGLFRTDTPQRRAIYQYCRAQHRALPVETLSGRSKDVANLTLHLIFAKNTFGCINLIGILAYWLVSKSGDYIAWHTMSLKIRKAKVISPFQHDSKAFMVQPNIPHLRSVLHGMNQSKVDQDYERIIQRELDNRRYLLDQIPSHYHSVLFPWLTPELMELKEQNRGITTYCWVVPAPGDNRHHMCKFLNDHFVIAMENTTWEFHMDSSGNVAVGRSLCEQLVYLPNLNELNSSQVQDLARVLTKYCRMMCQDKKGGDDGGAEEKKCD